MSFVCEALYLGHQAVEGAQTPASIGEVVEAFVRRPEIGGPQAAEIFTRRWCSHQRVQLQLDEERIRLVPVRRDEGFESDSEGSSGSLCDDACCSNATTTKGGVHDHVQRLDKLLRQDSLDNTSGEDSLDVGNAIQDSAKNICPNVIDSPNDSLNTSTASSTGIGSDSSNGACRRTDTDSSSNKISAEDGTLSSSGNESEEDGSPRLQRATMPSCSDSPCCNESNESIDHDLSNLQERNVAALPEVVPGGNVFFMSDILFCHICGPYPKVVVVVAKVTVPGSLLRAHVLECLTQQAAKTLYSHYYKASNRYKLNRYRNNSKRKSETAQDLHNNANVNADFPSGNFNDNIDVFNSLRNCAVRKDSGNSSIGEGSSARGSIRSMQNNGDDSHDKNINVIEVRANEGVDDSQPFSLVQHTDSDGITHIEIESGPVSLLNGGSVSSDFSSIISLSTPENNDINHSLKAIKNSIKRENSLNNKSSRNLISNELENTANLEREKRFRQRQPAMLICDVGESYDQKLARKSAEEQKEAIARKERFVGENFRSRELGRPPLPPPSSWAIPERQSRPRDVSRNRNQINRESKDREHRDREYRERDAREREFREKEIRSRENRDMNARNRQNKVLAPPPPPPPPRRHPHDSSLLLVPTKSGHEPKRSYYPKESHIVRGNKVVRVDFPSVPVWGHRIDSNNNGRPMIHYPGGWAHEFHAPRIREPSFNSDMRRRSRSKSPARRQVTSNRYLEAVTTFNFSQKLKELSGTVFPSKKPHSNNIVNLLPPVPGNWGNHRSGQQRTGADSGPLRPVIRTSKSKTNESDNRRVTFSAYATVQLMDL